MGKILDKTKKHEKQINIGDKYPSPCGHKGSVVWISKDKKCIAVKCSKDHKVPIKKVYNQIVMRKTKPVYILKVT